MSHPKSAVILQAVVDKLKEATAINSGKVWSHVPQDQELQAGNIVSVRLVSQTDWSTKDSEGLEIDIQVDIWVPGKSEKQALTLQDEVVQRLHDASLTLPSGANGYQVLCQFRYSDGVYEPDGITHHTIVRFALIVSN